MKLDKQVKLGNLNAQADLSGTKYRKLICLVRNTTSWFVRYEAQADLSGTKYS